MTDPPQTTVTQILDQLRGGNRSRFNELLPLVYDELCTLAHRQRQRWHGDHTVNTTALVHEAYLKLVDQTNADWKSRAHFFAVAAKAMRYILIDYARSRRAQKRGGDVSKVPLDEIQVSGKEDPSLPAERAEELVALDEALDRLAQIDALQSSIVECRFFGGMTIRETAAALGVSTATANRHWATARTWLYREMQQTLKG